MRQLAYYIAFGGACLDQFRMSLNSIRDYEVDIALITNMDFKDDRVRVIHRDLPPKIKHCFMFRIEVQKYIDLSQYDRVWYIDCDILIFEDIFTKYTQSDAILLSNEPKWTMGHECFCGGLAGGEWQIYKDLPAINAGIYSVPKMYYNTWFNLYRDSVNDLYNRLPMMNIPEQMALNAIYARNRDKYKYALIENIGYPEKGVKGNEDLYHFACYVFTDKLPLMKQRWNERVNR